MVKVVGKGSQKKVEEILKYASIDRYEAAPAAKPKLQPGPLWGWGAEDSQLVRQEDAPKEPLREDDTAEFSFFKRVLDKKYSSPEQPTAVIIRSASTCSISSSMAATSHSLSEQPQMLQDLCFDEAEQQLLSAAAKVTPLGLVQSQMQRANRAAKHAKTMKGDTNTAGGTKQGNAKEAIARTSKPASSAKVHTNKRQKMPQDKSAKQVDQQSTKKRPASTRTAAENEEAPTECYEDCDADVTDDQEANMENEWGEEEEDEKGGDEEDREDDEECEPPVTRAVLRHRVTSSAYRTAKTTSNNNGDSPNTQGLKTRDAYKKAACEFDASH